MSRIPRSSTVRDGPGARLGKLDLPRAKPLYNVDQFVYNHVFIYSTGKFRGAETARLAARKDLLNGFLSTNPFEDCGRERGRSADLSPDFIGRNRSTRGRKIAAHTD